MSFPCTRYSNYLGQGETKLFQNSSLELLVNYYTVTEGIKLLNNNGFYHLFMAYLVHYRQNTDPNIPFIVTLTPDAKNKPPNRLLKI